MNALIALPYHVFIGFPLCVLFVSAGLLFCLTILGIPIGVALIAAGIKAL